MPGSFIPLSVPCLSGKERDYILQCLDDNWVSTAGPFVTEFEQRFAVACGAKRAVACASGTAALHLALLGIGVGQGDLVILPDLTFIATANAVRYVGAIPVFMDVDPYTAHLSVSLLKDFLDTRCDITVTGTYDRQTGCRVAAIVPVHLLGHAADMKKIMALASKWNVPVIEDAAEATGVTIDGRSAGMWGKAGCFSFNGNKMLTAGAGGMIVTDDEDLATRIKHLSEQAKTSGYEYVHSETGFNYRMSNLHAAMGVGQLEQMEEFIKRKTAIAERYVATLGQDKRLGYIGPADGVTPNWWLFTIVLRNAVDHTWSRGMIDYLATQNIQARPLWQPMHQSPAFSGISCFGGGVEADHFYAKSVSLPSSVDLTTSDQDRVIRAVLDYLDTSI